MTLAVHEAAAKAEFRPMLEVEMDIGVFVSNWTHCDRISSYLARMVSHNRTDSLLYSNLFSSALNELLETVFRSHAGEGRFRCHVSRAGSVDRVELTIPADDDRAAFYVETVRELHRPTVSDRYRKALFAQGPLDLRIGLYELAVDYGAVFSVEQPDSATVRLTADLALEDSEQ
ncbi:MAG: ubiquinone biosynthesis methyltransferase UbiE [Rhizobiaceae bacterium]|nr:ubiquinone biosynthesis methyltransferase UbiE [Rhizobiaceae bacterium]